jgi:hypothetical protein
MLRRSAFDPNEIQLMRLAFVVAWKFVEVDPSLAAVSKADRRKLLVQAVLAAFSRGEGDVAEIANKAIASMREVVTPAPGTHRGGTRMSPAGAASASAHS